MRTLVALVAAALVLTVPAPAGARDADALASTGYVLGGTPDRIVERDAHALATLGVDGVGITPDGRDVAVPGRQLRHLLATAHANGLRAELLVHNVNEVEGDFDSHAAAALLRHPHRVRAVAKQLASFVEEDGWDGVHIDLESLTRKDGPGLVQLAEELQSRMPADKTVSLAMMAATQRLEYPDLGYRLGRLDHALDTIALMTYDQHGPGWSGPGPIGALSWQRKALEALFSVVPASKVDVGIAGYGYFWTRDGGGHALTLRQVRAMVAKDGATPQWRPRPGEWTARLSDGTVLWWSDGDSYQLRVQLAHELGAHGLALWRLGSADPLP